MLQNIFQILKGLKNEKSTVISFLASALTGCGQQEQSACLSKEDIPELARAIVDDGAATEAITLGDVMTKLEEVAKAEAKAEEAAKAARDDTV